MGKKSASIIAVFFALLYLFFLLVMDPRLIWHVQEPPFLRGMQFFSSFLKYPGGPVWYASAFITQFHIFPRAGAFSITLVMFLNYRQSNRFLKVTGSKNHSELVGALPVLLLFAAYCDYMLPLSYAIGICIALLLSNLYVSCSCNKRYLRISLFGIVAIAAYYLTGTGVLLCALVCGLYEFLSRKNCFGGTVIVAVAALLPLIAARYVFIISIASAYYDFMGLKTNLLEAAHYPRTPPLIYGVYLFFPAMFVVRHLVSVCDRMHCRKNVPHAEKYAVKIRGIPGRVPALWMWVGVIAAVGICTAWCCFDGKEKANYRIDRHARHRRWDMIVREVTPANLDDYSVLSQMHLFRALHYRNRLLSDLFSYPGALPGQSFLMVTGKMATYYPVQMSDCFFEVGAMNQAEYWAHEALALKGKKPWILQRLALINLLKGRKNSAGKFIALLDKTLLYRDSARTCRRFCENDPLIDGNEYLHRIRSYMTRREYLCRDFYSELVNLFESNSDNRTAFEYIVAINLLNNSIGPVIDNTGFFKRFGYSRLPRHVQEAVVFQRAMVRSSDVTCSGFKLDSNYFHRFEKFNRTLFRFQNDKDRALEELAPGYGRTYWFYLASTNRPVLLKESD